MSELGEISKIDEFVIEWSIKDFLSLPVEVDAFYFSPHFYFASVAWFLRLYPNGVKKYPNGKESEGYIDLYLQRESSGPPISMEYTLGTKAVDGKLCNTMHISYTFDEMDLQGPLKWLNRTKLLERKSHLLPSDTLTLVCKMERPSFNETTSLNNIEETKCSCHKSLGVHEDIQSHLRECEVLPIKCRKCGNDVALKNWFDRKCQMVDTKGIESLQRDLRDFLTSENISDVTLIVKGREFRAHRSILAARSPVFLSMMMHDTKEKMTGIVEIKDTDPDSFSEFLLYVYTGNLEQMTSENVHNLYRTADKYQVNELKKVCLKFMLKNISVENFCDVLALSLQYEEKDMTDMCIDFFLKNSMEIVTSNKWQEFILENPIAGNELFIKHLQVNKHNSAHGLSMAEESSIHLYVKSDHLHQ